MRRRRVVLVGWFLALTLGTGMASARTPKPYEPPDEDAALRLKQDKENSKFRLNTFGQELEQKPKPIPWMALGLLGIVIAFVTPIAYKSFRRTARELGRRR